MSLTKQLLTAVANGDEDDAKVIVKSYPELLQNSSATTTDVAGKKIEKLTPLQYAICAGDVDMLQMIKEVLQQKLQRGKQLSFEPIAEINRQILTIYPNGIDAVQIEQIVKADTFKSSALNKVFAAINVATDEQVQDELNTPGQNITVTEEDVIFPFRNPGKISARMQLNIELHNFRKQFTIMSNQETIFNPFYLLKAYEFYIAMFESFSGNNDYQWKRRELFLNQIIGYIQRHLPACYLQEFAQGKKAMSGLTRSFEFKNDNGFYMRPADGVNNLGYMWAGASSMRGRSHACSTSHLNNIIQTKKTDLDGLRTIRVAAPYI